MVEHFKAKFGVNLVKDYSQPVFLAFRISSSCWFDKREHKMILTVSFNIQSVSKKCVCVYISIVIHRQICFVLSELISVARQYLPVAGIKTRLTQTSNQSF